MAGPAPDLRVPDGEPLPVVALPDSCAMRRFLERRLDEAGISYFIAHSASGIAGVQSALVAGLGVSCLNASAIPAGAQVYRACTLPSLPDVEFALMPPREGEAPLVTDVRRLPAGQFDPGRQSIFRAPTKRGVGH